MSFSISFQVPEYVQRFFSTHSAEPADVLPPEVADRVRAVSERFEREIDGLIAELSSEGMSQRKEEVLRELRHLLQDPKTLLMNIMLRGVETLAKTKERVEQELDVRLAALRKRLDPVLASIKELREREVLAKKWRDLGLDDTLLVSHPDFAEFLVSSGLVYTIVTLQNSTRAGADYHKIAIGESGEPELWLEGKRCPWSWMKKMFVADPEGKRLVLREDPNEQWTYVAPDGLVPASRYRPGKLYPCELLSYAEYRQLQRHADRFWASHDEVDPGVEKPCVLQVITMRRDKLPGSILTDNLNAGYPAHTWFRIIDEKGRVYSGGAEIAEEDQPAVLSGLRSFLTTARASVSTINSPLPRPFDYEESHPFDERLVTSIPMTIERKDAILDNLEGLNGEPALPFNFARQNCTKITVEAVLKPAGVAVDTRMRLGSLLGSLMPDMRELLPGSFFAVTARISETARCLYRRAIQSAPACVRRIVPVVTNEVAKLAERVETAVSTSLMLLLGGTKTLRPRVPGTLGDLDNDDHLTTFSALLLESRPFTDTAPVAFDHPMLLRAWQWEQASTVRYGYEGVPKLYGLVPA